MANSTQMKYVKAVMSSWTQEQLLKAAVEFAAFMVDAEELGVRVCDNDATTELVSLYNTHTGEDYGPRVTV